MSFHIHHQGSSQPVFISSSSVVSLKGKKQQNKYAMPVRHSMTQNSNDAYAKQIRICSSRCACASTPSSLLIASRRGSPCLSSLLPYVESSRRFKTISKSIPSSHDPTSPVQRMRARVKISRACNLFFFKMKCSSWPLGFPVGGWMICGPVKTPLPAFPRGNALKKHPKNKDFQKINQNQLSKNLG